jgi:beta-alanine--pyruvate transaminase
MKVYEEEAVFSRAAALAPYLEDAVHSLRGSPHVVDIRNIGLMSGVEVAARSDGEGKRGHDIFLQGLDAGVYYRTNGDTVAIAPPLISEKHHIDTAVEALRKILASLG